MYRVAMSCASDNMMIIMVLKLCETEKGIAPLKSHMWQAQVASRVATSKIIRVVQASSINAGSPPCAFAIDDTRRRK